MQKNEFRLLIVEDDVSYAHKLRGHLKSHFSVDLTHSLEEAEKILLKNTYHLILLDIGLGKASQGGFSLLEKIRNSSSPAFVIMLSGHDDSKTIMDSLSQGAVDFVSKTNAFDEIVERIKLIAKNHAYEEENARLRSIIAASIGEYAFITEDPHLLKVLSNLTYVKDNTRMNILITGETGVGKELIARYIHGLGATDRPFVVVNCAALPDSLIESTLFGHKRGSFTGASEDRIGKFELAHGGDIFLDEVGTLKPDIQARFLRVLQEKEVERVGSHHTKKVQFRVIAATNENLDNLVESKKFRLDLYHRLNNFPLVIPPLRERVCDIDLLMDHFAKGTEIEITEEVRKVFRAYAWPGNVRELQSVVRTMCALKRSGKITPADIPMQLRTVRTKPVETEGYSLAELFERTKAHGLRVVLDDIEKTLISEAFQKCKNQIVCAELLKLSEPSITRKLKLFGLK